MKVSIVTCYRETIQGCIETQPHKIYVMGQCRKKQCKPFDVSRFHYQEKQQSINLK